MFWHKKLLITIGALAFSFGILSVGYGFWTDSLDIEGEADVSFRVDVTDDIIEEMSVTPEALVLVENPVLDSAGTDTGGSANEQPGDNLPEPEVKPDDTTEVPIPDDSNKPEVVDDSNDTAETVDDPINTDDTKDDSGTKPDGTEINGADDPNVTDTPENGATGTEPGSL